VTQCYKSTPRFSSHWMQKTTCRIDDGCMCINIHDEQPRALTRQRRRQQRLPLQQTFGSAQNVVGRFATNVDFVLKTRCASGNLSFGVISCLMYGRRTSADFSISMTRRICGRGLAHQ
jgi:hypothetical protein